MQLVAEIEEKFAVEFSTDEILTMESIGAARKLLKDKGVPGI
jgi:acyl carrier protein